MIKQCFSALTCALVTLIGLSSAKAEGPWAFQYESLFMRLHTSHGASTDNALGLDPANRFALSYVRDTNVGARITYFDYDHSGTFTAPGGTRLISLDMQNTDFEIFKRFNLSSQTTLEASGGLRKSVNEVFFPTVFEPNHFNGLGGFVGFRGTTKIFTGGDLYARGKYAILGGNGVHDGNAVNTPRRYDESRTQSELAFGYQHSISMARFIVTPHVGAEWMNLSSYLVDPVDEHPEGNMMLGGLTCGINVNF